MARPSKEKTPINTWFFAFVQNLVDTASGAQTTGENSVIDQKAQHEFNGEQNKKAFHDLIVKHAAFFETEQKLKQLDALTTSSVNNISEFDDTEEGCAGKIVISGRSIQSWIDPQVSDQGVRFVSSRPLLEQDLLDGDAVSNKSRQDPIFNTVAALGHVGLQLYVPDGVVVKDPFVIEYHNLPGSSFLPISTMVHIGGSASAKVVVNITDDGEEKQPSIIFQANQYRMDENAELFLFRNQNSTRTTAVFTSETITQERDSHAELFSWDNGGAMVETTFSAALAGAGAESIITGVYNPLNGQKYFYDTEQKHLASNTVSDLLFKGVIGKNAFTFWKGNIIVEPKTFGTNGYQANKNLIIDESAKVESIPGLEIITNDVRCSHGVTIGNIDRNHMFYLQSRGINKEEAEKLIIDGFLSSAKNRIRNQDFLKLVSTYFSI